MARLSASDIRSAAGTLRAVVERIAVDELTAPAGVVARLEGATAALEALGARGRRQAGDESREGVADA